MEGKSAPSKLNTGEMIEMNGERWNWTKIAIIAGVVLILLANGAGAETNRQKVVKEACYALDGGIDYACGSTATIKGNWNYLTDFNNQKQPIKGCFCWLFLIIQ